MICLQLHPFIPIDANIVIAKGKNLRRQQELTNQKQGITTRGFRTHIVQVFQNILSNAIHYIDKPEGHISIKCKRDEKQWVFSVADNGPGIEEKYFDKIFQMFQTLGMNKDSDGTGIGLALVKRIIEKWGGSIWVESKIGYGSTFFFTMPKTEG